MLQNTQAFILKVNPKGETSAILHCFSKDFGRIILIAKGARSSKSPFKGLIEPFSLLNVHYKEKKDRAYQFLSQAEYLKPYTKLKNHPESVLFGSIILEILYKEHENDPNKATFELLKQVFDLMENGRSAQMAHWYFLLKYLDLEGLSLNTLSCLNCEEPMEHGYFFPKKGYIFCENCREDFSLNWELDRQQLTILQDLGLRSTAEIPKTIDKEIDKELINRVLWNTLATRFDHCRTLKSVEVLRKVL